MTNNFGYGWCTAKRFREVLQIKSIKKSILVHRVNNATSGGARKIVVDTDKMKRVGQWTQETRCCIEVKAKRKTVPSKHKEKTEIENECLKGHRRANRFWY